MKNLKSRFTPNFVLAKFLSGQAKFVQRALMAVFLSCTAVVFAQQDSAGRLSASDAVEIETEIGALQMKASQRIEKPTIKPRADYKQQMTSKDDKNTMPQAVTLNPLASGGHLPDVADNLTLSNSQLPAEMISDEQVVELSASLRKLIEDNSELKKQIADLDGQLKAVRGQQRLESNRLNEVALERDALKKQNENIVSQGHQTQKRLEALEADLTQKEQDYSMQIVRLQTQLAQKLQSAAVQASSAASNQTMPVAQEPALGAEHPSVSVDLVSAPTPQEAKERGQKVLLALSSVSQEKQKLAEDEARVHYNMGNTYFNQGDYLKAGKEYVRALELSPEDASAHYNLAFVSGEFLNDPKMALEHYRKYLYFNPYAQDAQMVEQKIIEAEIAVKGDVLFRSKINEELRIKKNDVNSISVE